jgi:hypothetical protein
MKRWVGLGVIADHLINIGRAKNKAGRSVVLLHYQSGASNTRRTAPAGLALRVSSATIPKTSILRPQSRKHQFCDAMASLNQVQGLKRGPATQPATTRCCAHATGRGR